MLIPQTKRKGQQQLFYLRDDQGGCRSPYIDCIDRQTGLYSTGAICELQAVFKVFDQDKSGLMDVLEFQLVLRNVVEVNHLPSVRCVLIENLQGANIRSSEKAMAYRDLDSNGEFLMPMPGRV